MEKFMRSILKKVLHAFWGTGLALALVGVQPAYAAGIVVNSSDDSLISGDGKCTLREAITNANNDNQSGSTDCPAGSGADTITIGTSYVITLTSQLPPITSTITIDASSSALLPTIQASICNPVTLPGGCSPATYRVLNVSFNGSLTLNHVIVRHGYCAGSCSDDPARGGGIYNNGNLTIINSTIDANKATEFGGGIYHSYVTATLSVSNSSISNNYAVAGVGHGGGIYAARPVVLTNVTFYNNLSFGNGGGLYNTLSDSSLTDVTFDGNYGFFGGGMYNYNSAPTLKNVTFMNNSNTQVSGEGGGMYNSGGSPILANVTFSANSGNASGGGMKNDSGNVTLTNVTFSGNTAVFGQGGGLSSVNGTTTLKNAIFWGNTAPNSTSTASLLNTLNTTNISYSIVQGSGGSSAWNSAFGTDGGNNLDVDPLLYALANNGGLTKTMALGSGSPAINAGSDAICAAAPVSNTSQNGATRPKGAHCDIGAYEFVQSFADVPSSHQYWLDIEILYANGLTAGCSVTPLNFCPDQIMDRAQSAVFNLRGSFGTSYTPPAAPWDRFADDWSAGTWAERWAEGMWNAGLTAGCATSPLRYCPWDQTPKAQAAVFGLRLKYGNSYVPPAATGTVFFDMTNTAYFGTKWAEQAYADGLLPNCGTDIGSGKPLFCPNDLVSRGLGAYMIVRAKNLTMP
jgi:CSLREA domain-containing protein